MFHTGICDDDTTQWPDLYNDKTSKIPLSNPGAARQILGSSALRPFGGIPSTKHPRLNYDDRRFSDNQDTVKVCYLVATYLLPQTKLTIRKFTFKNYYSFDPKFKT